jgi:hypothetical protein
MVYTTSLWWWLGDGLWWFTIVLPCLPTWYILLHPFLLFCLWIAGSKRNELAGIASALGCLRYSTCGDHGDQRRMVLAILHSLLEAGQSLSWRAAGSGAKAPKGALMLSGCQVQESHPVVLLWRDYSPCLAHLSWFSPAKLQAWSWLCVWNQAFASRRSQTSASAGCSKICTCSLACHYLSSTRRDPVSICFNTFNVSQKTWHTTTKTIRIQRCVSGQVKA